MKRHELIERIRSISASNPDINNTIELIANGVIDEDIEVLIMQLDKGQWLKTAMILRSIGFPRLNSSVDRLLYWMQDINWPGTHIIMDTLSTADPDILTSAIGRVARIAISEQDTMWLAGINVFLVKKNISLPKLDQDVMRAIAGASEY